MRNMKWGALLSGVLLSACGGPSDADLAWLIENEYAGITDLVVTDVTTEDNNWIKVSGTGELAEAHYDLYRGVKIVESCGYEPGMIIQASKSPVVADGYVLSRTADAGAPVTFAINMAPAKADADDRPELVSPKGWRNGSWGGGYDLASPDAPRRKGYRQGWFKPERFATAIQIGTPAFDALCQSLSEL